MPPIVITAASIPLVPFATVIAGINAGVYRHWYKMDEVSGSLLDAGTGNTTLNLFNGAGALGYEVTGSEAVGTVGKAIAFPGNRSVGATTSAMGGNTGAHSLHIAVKTTNAAAGGGATQFFVSVAPDNNAHHFRLGANRNSDSNGVLQTTMQTSSGNDTHTFLFPGDFPNGGAWDDDEWHYYCIVQRLDGVGMVLYVDGQEAITTNANNGTGTFDDTLDDIGIDNFDNLKIGSEADSAFSNKTEAHIDNMLMWQNYALTSQEVLDLFESI